MRPRTLYVVLTLDETTLPVRVLKSWDWTIRSKDGHYWPHVTRSTVLSRNPVVKEPKRPNRGARRWRR